MNRTDHIAAEFNPALLARLQATMPDPTTMPPQNGVGADGEAPAIFGLGSTGSTSGVLENPLMGGMNSSPRLHQTTFSSGSRDRYAPVRPPEPKKSKGLISSCLEAIRMRALLILGIALVGILLGYLYSKKVCVPLYRIQASLEVRNNKSGAHTEALARVLTSQSLVGSVLAGMPQAERALLVESRRIPGVGPGPGESEDLLHQRLDSNPIPSAQVIDISFVSPNRPAAIDFVNSLVQALAKRVQDQKSASTSLPDDWNNQPERSTDEIAVIDPATSSTDPVSPSLTSNLLFGGAYGTLLGIVIALLSKFTSRTFAGPGSVGEVLGVRELGAIPERKLLGPPGSDNGSGGLQMDANDESLRYLRSSLLYHPGRQAVRCLAFTSAAPGEGKTTVVANLSMSLAATGRRVLVIDGDLRRPRLHKLMQIPAGPGLADLLRRDPGGRPLPLSRFVNATSFQNLYVLPPGTGGSDAPELLAGPYLSQLFRELSKSFDFILIDTPPLLACSDARNYARAVEGVVLVVRSSETQKRAALVARDMLLQDGATIIGTVLTGWRQNYPAYNYPSTTNYAKS